jgi:hypothetical protein
MLEDFSNSIADHPNSHFCLLPFTSFQGHFPNGAIERLNNLRVLGFTSFLGDLLHLRFVAISRHSTIVQ